MGILHNKTSLKVHVSVSVMGLITSWILFSGLIVALVRAKCGDSCKAKGGICYPSRPRPHCKSCQPKLGDKYLGMCREGSWPNLCYCGYCYAKLAKPCIQVPSCRGTCSRRKPAATHGRGWMLTGDCSKGCKCYEETSPSCPTRSCNYGMCQPKVNGIPRDERVGACASSDCECYKCFQSQKCLQQGGYCAKKLPQTSNGESLLRGLCYDGCNCINSG